MRECINPEFKDNRAKCFWNTCLGCPSYQEQPPAKQLEKDCILLDTNICKVLGQSKAKCGDCPNWQSKEQMPIYKDLIIIYENNGKPYGIRDSTGFLLFFRQPSKYEGQEERYQKELKEINQLAEHILHSLSKAKLENMLTPADQEQKHCTYNPDTNIWGKCPWEAGGEHCKSGCFYWETELEQPTPEMPLIEQIYDNVLDPDGFYHDASVRQQIADMAWHIDYCNKCQTSQLVTPNWLGAHDAAIRAQAAKEFADKIIKILDDMYKDNEIEDDNVTGWNSAITSITRDIKAEGGIE